MYQNLLIFLFLGLFAFVIVFPISPAFREVPFRDSGVFLYAGQNILDGGLPYLSVWDHKGPLIYYIDALGLALIHNSWWGTWAIEFLFIYASLITGYILLQRLFGFLPAIIGSISWLTLLCFFIEGGNFTEEYGILFQFVIFYLFYVSEQERSDERQGYLLIGITTCLVFLLKPNLIGVSFAILLYLAAKTIIDDDKRQTWGKIKYFFTGFMAGIIPLSLIFCIQGNFFEFVDQFFFYNLVYSGTNVTSKFLAFEHLFSTIAYFHLEIVILASCLFAIVFVVRAQDTGILKKFLIISLINLPIEVVLISYSGMQVAHYLMTLLPIIAIFISFFVYCITSDFSLFKNPGQNRLQVFSGKVLAIILLFGLCITPFVYSFIFTQFAGCYDRITTHKSTDTDDAAHSTIRFIRENTTKDDYVLVFGAETAINFVTQRKSPTRYAYQYPLYMEGYDTPIKDQEFLSDLAKKPPRLIILTGNGATPFEKFKTIIKNYPLVAEYGNWKIYQKPA
jgi:hypothetical protein